MGIMVDNVSEVIDFQADRIEPPPEFGTQINTDFILGLGKKLVESETSDEEAHETVVMLLDVDRILTTEELNTIAAKS
jgi:purine-binding chemotaxis protein CheW